MWNNNNTSDIAERFNYIKKDQVCMINELEAAGRILNSQQFKLMSMRDKLNLFMIDFDLIPLLIFVHYIYIYIYIGELYDTIPPSN